MLDPPNSSRTSRRSAVAAWIACAAASATAAAMVIGDHAAIGAGGWCIAAGSLLAVALCMEHTLYVRRVQHARAEALHSEAMALCGRLTARYQRRAPHVRHDQ